MSNTLDKLSRVKDFEVIDVHSNVNSKTVYVDTNIQFFFSTNIKKSAEIFLIRRLCRASLSSLMYTNTRINGYIHSVFHQLIWFFDEIAYCSFTTPPYFPCSISAIDARYNEISSAVYKLDLLIKTLKDIKPYYYVKCGNYDLNSVCNILSDKGVTVVGYCKQPENHLKFLPNSTIQTRISENQKIHVKIKPSNFFKVKNKNKRLLLATLRGTSNLMYLYSYSEVRNPKNPNLTQDGMCFFCTKAFNLTLKALNDFANSQSVSNNKWMEYDYAKLMSSLEDAYTYLCFARVITKKQKMELVSTERGL